MGFIKKKGKTPLVSSQREFKILLGFKKGCFYLDLSALGAEWEMRRSSFQKAVGNTKPANNKSWLFNTVWM